jgi:uncharacterized membrane protein
MKLFRDRRGSASLLTAISMIALTGAASLCVDLGALYLRSRQLQGVADEAAMAAAQDLDHAERRARRVLRLNGLPDTVRVETALGRYDPDASRAPGERFITDGADANAVRVEIREDAPLFFSALLAPSHKMTIARAAIAAQARLASFQIGSRLLAVRAGVANAVLSGLTGSEVSLTAMDYDSLAHTDIDLLAYADALRTHIGAGAASYDHVLASEIETNDALGAIADLAAQQSEPALASALAAIAAASENLDRKVALGDLIDLGPYGPQDAIGEGGDRAIAVSALDLTTAILELANGARQVRLDLAAAAPGLANVTAWLAIGERENHSPWIAATKDGAAIVRTAQMRLYLDATIAIAGAPGLTGARLPVLIEAASAQARLSALECGASPLSTRVRLDVSPSLGAIAIADADPGRLDDFKTPLELKPARIVGTKLLSLTGQARADLGGGAWQSVTFSGDEIADGAVKTVRTRDIAQASAASLVSNLDLKAEALGLGLGLDAGALTAPVRPALTAAAAPADDVIAALTDLIGLRLGEADVRVNGARCHGVALVG